MADRQEYVKLERRLVLLNWLNSLFGYKQNKEMLEDTSGTEEGFDGAGRSFLHHHIIGRGDKVKIDRALLEIYDDNIRSHLNGINAHRKEPIKLRYFQYLALLYTEIYLDRYFHHRGSLLAELNEFVRENNARKAYWEPEDEPFTETDLRKLAFWMATGSGKTLIMHFNYRQFLHYNREPLDNILLITPNEGMTEQHILEMTASGIPSQRFNLEESGLGLSGRNVVRVIEITKLVEVKRGGGLSVDVECFEGNNLIFVDEGHKGSGGEVWRKMRNILEQTGFTFEYSATFGQALTAARNDELTKEYGKSIIFDYSYKYFYGDGFGKDFHILNLKEETSEEDTDVLLAGNLLSFYEQLRYFTEQDEALSVYNLDPPLWVFVGSRVNAVYTENRTPRSDVLTVARFLHKFVSQRKWAIDVIGKIIAGGTGILNANDEDLFEGKFKYLRKLEIASDTVYDDILVQIFHSAGGALHLAFIRGSDGEIGLKVGEAKDYSGLIYIGDTSSFKNLVEENEPEIILEEDAVSGSLFEPLNRPGSPINILIDAKKFMEGWNSWRVSNMGLLNIGKREGSEIIQLFGRGVRLKGKEFSLKRSSYLSSNSHPEHLKLLETLNIFAVRANYMAQFRDYLEREGVDTEGFVVVPLPIRKNEEFLKKNLIVLRLPEGKNFIEECDFRLQPDEAAKVTVDVSLRLTAIDSEVGGLKTAEIISYAEKKIPAESLDLLNWESIYLQMLEFKEAKGFRNLVIRCEELKSILETDNPTLYGLIAGDSVFRPENQDERFRLQEAVISILRKYIEKYYRVVHQRWDSENMVPSPIAEDDANFQDYTLRIPRSETAFLNQIKELIEEGERLYQDNRTVLPNIYFDRHLYQPLLVEKKNNKFQQSPPGLNESEKRFVGDLKVFLRNGGAGIIGKKEVFLLRNLSRGKGIGFFENEGFYPDFILWIKEGEHQRIIFIEPHGMRQEKAFEINDKIRLCQKLREYSEHIRALSEYQNITLDSFIISQTPFEELRKVWGEGNWDKEKFVKNHILFFDEDYVQKLFINHS